MAGALRPSQPFSSTKPRTADGYERRGRMIDMKTRADEALAAGSSSIESVIVVNNTARAPTQPAEREPLSWVWRTT